MFENSDVQLINNENCYELQYALLNFTEWLTDGESRANDTGKPDCRFNE